MLRLLGDFFSQTPTGAVLLDPPPDLLAPLQESLAPLCPPPTLAVWSRHWPVVDTYHFYVVKLSLRLVTKSLLNALSFS